MFHSKFQEVLNHFNYIEGTNAECVTTYMHNFVVSGLTSDQLTRLTLVYKYNPERHVGTDVIGEDMYNSIKPRNATGVSLYPKLTIVEMLDYHEDALGLIGNLSSPLLQPSPRSKRVLVADLSNDTMGVLTDRLTHDKVYNKISKPSGRSVEVLCDDGIKRAIGSCWFKEVYLYNEDETELTCRDIEFKEDDYIDLRKHTPEQIRHIAKFYKFYDVNQLLSSGKHWYRIYWDIESGFVGTILANYKLGKEYTYDDIFYKEA